MAEEKELTHAEKIDRHFKILGRPNPFKAVHSAQARAGERKGGLGSNKGAARYERTSAADRKKANTDDKFGYFDEVNKRYVPALFDAIDGGGRDTRGDTFKGGMYSELLNDLGVNPYGSQRERMFVSPTTSPIMQAVANPQSNVDPRVLTSRGYEPDNIAQPAATVMNQQVGISDPLTFRSGPETLNPMMASVMEQARNLAARAGLNFDMMPQEQKAQYINAVMPLN